MNAVLDSLLKVDLSRVPHQVLEGLKSGRMILSEAKGTVYWAEGSGGQGIVMHLPLVPVSTQELASAEQLLQVGQAVKAAQIASVATTAVAAAVVVAVVVVATTYLAAKIENVQNAVHELAGSINEQDRREYLKQVTDYIGAVRAAQELLNSPASQRDIEKLAEQQINRLADLRQRVLGYVRGLQSASSHDVRAMPFMMEMLDFVPAALAVERSLCFAAGMPSVAQARRDQAAPHFREELAAFRRWCEEQYRQLARGQSSHATVNPAQRAALRVLFNSPVHDILLGDWTGVAADHSPTPANNTVTRHGLKQATDSTMQTPAYETEMGRSA